MDEWLLEVGLLSLGDTGHRQVYGCLQIAVACTEDADSSANTLLPRSIKTKVRYKLQTKNICLQIESFASLLKITRLNKLLLLRRMVDSSWQVFAD